MNRLRFPRKRGSRWVTAAALEGDGIGTIHLCRVISRANLLPSRPMCHGYVRLNVAGMTREQLEEVFNAARVLSQLLPPTAVNTSMGNTYSCGAREHSGVPDAIP